MSLSARPVALPGAGEEGDVESPRFSPPWFMLADPNPLNGVRTSSPTVEMNPTDRSRPVFRRSSTQLCALSVQLT